MIIIPAIDLYQNQCVRLHKGSFKEMTIYSSDPVKQAIAFEETGATHLHLVDLEAAEKGSLRHIHILKEIKKQTRLKVDAGGGIRTIQQARTLIDAGADQINIGTLAVEQPSSISQLIADFGPERIILSADRNGGLLKTHGWKRTANISFRTFIQNFVDCGGQYIVSTEISRDGTLSGPDVAGYQQMMKDFPSLKIIASGGVSDDSDITALGKIGVYGAIVGKAIYEGKINLAQTLKDQTSC